MTPNLKLCVLQFWWKRLVRQQSNRVGFLPAQIEYRPFFFSDFFNPVEKNFCFLQADAFADGADGFPAVAFIVQ